jgi:hypothetical protein
MDHFTKWIEEFAILEATAKMIAQYFVKKIIFRHRCLEKLLLDRRKAFIGELMREILKEIEIYAI